MKKEFNTLNGTCQVIFSLPKEVTEDISSVVVMGDFSEWHPIPMFIQDDGTFMVKIEIPTGHDYHFRYQIDNLHWENDWSADRYETSPVYPHIENSVLSLLHEKV